MVKLLQEAKSLRDLPALSAGDSMLMGDTALENVFTCQPQHQNMHGRVFGGFIMRRVFELAFSTCYLFAGTRPGFFGEKHLSSKLHRTLLPNERSNALEGMDEISFKRPVDVGDLLRIHTQVVHVEPLPSPGRSRVHIEAVVSVTRPETASSVVSNSLNLSFDVRNTSPGIIPDLRNEPVPLGVQVTASEGRRLKRVLPSTMEEAAKLRRWLGPAA